MSNKLLQVHFAFSGPFGDEMSTQLAELAQSINQEPGFIWKIWTENSATQEAGGIYLFEDEQSAQAYAKKHAARLRQFACRRCSTRFSTSIYHSARLTTGRSINMRPWLHIALKLPCRHGFEDKQPGYNNTRHAMAGIK